SGRRLGRGPARTVPVRPRQAARAQPRRAAQTDRDACGPPSPRAISAEQRKLATGNYLASARVARCAASVDGRIGETLRGAEEEPTKIEALAGEVAEGSAHDQDGKRRRLPRETLLEVALPGGADPLLFGNAGDEGQRGRDQREPRHRAEVEQDRRAEREIRGRKPGERDEVPSGLKTPQRPDRPPKPEQSEGGGGDETYRERPVHEVLQARPQGT